jgi:excisionase family DNA binding protein
LSLADSIEQFDHCLNAKELARILGVQVLTVYRQAASGELPSFRIASCIRFDPRKVAAWMRAQQSESTAAAPALPEPPPAIEGRAMPADRTPVAPEPAYEEGATCSGEITREGYTMSFPNHGEFLVSTDEHAGGKYLGEVCECFLGRLPLDKFEAMYLEVRDSVPYPEDTDKMWLHLKTQIQWRTQ